MSINSIQSSIGFPHLVNNQTGMIMPNSIQQPKKASPPQIALPVEPLPPPPKKRMKDDTKYYLGAAAIAASAIAGIYIYRTRMRDFVPEEFNNDSVPITHLSFRLVEHAKDKVLEFFSKCPELGTENKIEHTFQKLVRVDSKGKSILHKGEKKYIDRGLKRYDTMLKPGGAVKTTFVQDDGTVRAVIDWDDDGNLYRYVIKDKRGNIVRDYNYTYENISTKRYYNKDNIIIKEVQYNGKGWTYEVNNDKYGICKNVNEINPELK